MMQAGINVIQSLDLDPEATECMKMNNHYFSHSVLNNFSFRLQENDKTFQ
jgi:DNA (cytosine-5)-methyltransferase 1